jgi:D-alanyl-D-alanine carboxypeptidase
MHITANRGLALALAGLVVGVAFVIWLERVVVDESSSHAGLQQTLDRFVGSSGVPGATAYVVGPHGVWSGSAGVADVDARAPMQPGARMRIESNSKTWLVAVILQLVQEEKLGLDETVEHWLPGLLRDHGDTITVRELLHDASGLIDDNDVYRASAAERNAMFDRIGDRAVRRALDAVAARASKDPFAPIPAMVFIKLAAWQPLVASPGTTYHHSNIGWNVAGLIAARAGGKPLPELYRLRIFEPLGLKDTTFSPQGPIAGEHAHGYARANGELVDTTTMHPGKFADGAIVTNAKDEATFLAALVDGTLIRTSSWVDLYGLPSPDGGCGGGAYIGAGAGDGYRSYVRYSTSGDRVAVLLLNQNRGDGTAAVRRLYCGA